MRKLTSYVYVNDPDGATVAFGPDDTVPDWALAAITNPKAWTDTAPDVSDDTAGETADDPDVQGTDGDPKDSDGGTDDGVPATNPHTPARRSRRKAS